MNFPPHDLKRIIRWNKLLASANEFMTVPTLAKAINCSKDTLLRDCVMLADMGYMYTENKKVVRGKAVMYKASKPELDLKDYVPFEVRPTKSYVKKQETEAVIAQRGGRIIKLTDTTPWTPRPQKTGKVSIGSTFNMV